MNLHDLDAQYPYGGQSGWISFVVSAGQFAYWDMMTTQWRYAKHPPLTAETLLSGLGIESSSLEDGSILKWNAEKQKLEMTTKDTDISVNKATGKLDLRNRYARKIINGNLSFAASNIYPLITPSEGHTYTLYVKSNNGGIVLLPTATQDNFDGRPWILLSGSATLQGGKWTNIDVFFSGNEYFVEIKN